MNNSKSRIRSGFTFVEIFIVILVLGIMAAVAAPQYDAWIQSNRVRSACNTLVADLSYASTAARTQGTEITVNFDTARNGYQIPGLAHPHKPGKRFFVYLDDGPLKATLVKGSATLVFDKFGHAKTDASWVIQSDSSNWLTVKIGQSKSLATIE